MLDHPLVKIGDAFAAGVAEGEGQQGVKKTGQRSAEHPQGKPARYTQVLEVGFADGGGVFGEETPYSHKASRVGKGA